MLTTAPHVYPVPPAWSAEAKVDAAAYAAGYRRSLDDADAYWLEQAKRLDWLREPTRADESSFAEGDFGISWFSRGMLNAAANCIHRHLADAGDTEATLRETE